MDMRIERKKGGNLQGSESVENELTLRSKITENKDN
jgi:hypothetical protein